MQVSITTYIVDVLNISECAIGKATERFAVLKMFSNDRERICCST